MDISVVIHTFNSEKHLEKCLESVKFCKEIIVCDMCSTDRTVEIAYRYGAKVIYHKNLGFADPARNFAISYASQDWILVLNSDEEAPFELLEHLQTLTKTLPNHINAVFIPRKNIILGKVLWISYPNQLLRFFKNGTVSFSDKIYYPPTITRGGAHYIPPGRKNFAIIHHSYDSVASWIKSMNSYTDFELEKLQQEKIKFSVISLFTKPVWEFIKNYLLKGGFKQGLYGFVFSVFFSFYKFIALVKLWEKEFKKSHLQENKENNQEKNEIPSC